MLLERQHTLNAQRGMPVDDKGQSSTIVSVTGETVQLYYSNAGVMTADAGQAIGTVVVGQLAYDNIKNALGSIEGSKQDTSLSFTSTALTTEVEIDWQKMDAADYGTALNRMTVLTSTLSNGQYVVDYTNGTIYGKKASTQSSLTSAAYKVQSGVAGGTSAVASTIDVAKVGGVATAASAALADAVANPTVGSFGAYLRGFNGTTWDRLRTAVTTVSATLTGMLNTLPWAVFHTTPTTRTDGQGGPLEADAAGNTLVTLGTKIAGEDLTNNRMMVEHSYSGVKLAADTLVKTGAGFLHSLTFSCNDAVPTAGSIIVYDNTAESGTIIYSETFDTTPFRGYSVILDVAFSTGLYVGFTTTADINITPSYR